MRNCRRSTMMTLAFAAATIVSACSEQNTPLEPQGTENVTGAKFALSGSGDTAAIQFDIQRVSCDGEPIDPWSKTEVKQLLDNPDILTDYFILLKPGCYDVTAQPLKSDGTPSLDCSAGYIDQLVIIDGQTTEKGIQIQCNGEQVGAADLWIVLNTPPVITKVTFDPDKFVPYCSDQTICVEFKDSDGNPVDIEWYQRSGAPLAAGPTLGPITHDPLTKITSQCATLRHSGLGTVGLEVIAFDKRLDAQGNLIRVEDYYASMGMSVQSRDSLLFPSHGTIGGNCPCVATAEICDNFDNDCDGSKNEGLSCVCTPFDTQYCYTGPSGTAGVGECRSGGRPCELDGSGWNTTCYGQVLPQAEQCNNKDDDCDGQTDEGLPGCNPLCVVPSSQVCVYTGPAGTENVGECHAGTQICLAGQQWSSCTGEVVPVPEIAGNGLDDNCDGQIDENNCDAAGTLLAQGCNDVQLIGTYANGSCGTYTQVDNACAPQCGVPVGGTQISTACGWPGVNDLYGTYADGNCGTYDQVIQYNAQQCICQNPLPAGTPIGGATCSGYAQLQTYADGNCGTYTATLSSCSQQCGAPAYGTQLGESCGWPGPYDRYGTYADGNCGTYNQLILSNSPQCGGGCIQGTLVSEWCSGNARVGQYQNADCSLYTATISSCSSQCAPAYGTSTGVTWCSGTDLYGSFADGSCGTYNQLIQISSSQCVVCGDGVCNGNESSATCPQDCPPVLCSDGCFESDASGNYQPSGPYDAWKSCRPGGGFDFYLCSDALGCADYPAGCTYGGFHP